jgi:septation ring formation regulator EzrA
MQNETPEQTRIRIAFGKMPFGGITRFTFSSEMTFGVIAQNLESLVETLEHIAKQYEERTNQLRDLNNEVAAVRRVLGTDKL